MRHVGLHLSLRGLDRRGEGVDVVGAVVAPAVDEERRRAGDAAQVGRVDVLGDPGGAACRLAGRSRNRSTSRPSSLGVAAPGRAGRSSSWWASSRSCISQNAPCSAGGLGRLGGELGAAGARRSAAGAARRSGRRRSRPAARGRPARPARSTGTRSRRTRRPSPARRSGPRMWSRSGSTGIDQVEISSRRRRAAPAPAAGGGSAAVSRKTSQVSSDASTAAARGRRASPRPAAAPSNARVAISSDDGEADAGDRAAAERPRPSRPAAAAGRGSAG